MCGDIRVLPQDVRDHRAAHVQRRIHLVVHQTLCNRIHVLPNLPAKIHDNNPLYFRQIIKAGLNRPPVFTQVENLLVLVPGHKIIRAGMGHLHTTGIFIDVFNTLKSMGWHNRHATVKLHGQHIKFEPGCRQLEGQVDRQIINHGDGVDKGVEGRVKAQQLIVHLAFHGKHNIFCRHRHAVAPFCHRVKLDAQGCEIIAGIFDTFSQPGDILIRENSIIHQPFPHNGIAFRTGIARHRPGVCHPDRRCYAPTQHQGVFPTDIFQR